MPSPRDDLHKFVREDFDKYDEAADDYISVSERFSEFTYDETKYAYVAELQFDYEEEDAESVAVSFKFKNGKIAELKYSFDYEGAPCEISVSVTDYGNVTVELPAVEE